MVEGLVQQIYDGVTEPELAAMMDAWPTWFRSRAIHTMILDARGTVVDAAHVGIAGASREYEEKWRAEDPRMELSLRNRGRVLSDVHHIDAAAFERSDVYHAVLRPFGVRFSLFGTASLAGGHTLAQAAMRGTDQGCYDDEDVRTLAHLWPHLRRAIDLRVELRSLRDRVAGLVDALDAVPSPVLLLDGEARLQHLNASADRILAARDGLFVNGQRLLTSRPGTTSQLRVTIARALDRADATRSTTLRPLTVVEVERSAGRPLSLVVHPLRPRNALRTRGHDRARALVVVHDPDARTVVDPALVARVFALTPTEAELAAALAEGKTLVEFAVSRGCAEATARTHLKRVLEKTGSRRQAELVHRLLGTAALQLAPPR